MLHGVYWNNFFITLFFLHNIQHNSFCDNIQPCYNVNSIILIINLLLQVLQDSQYFNIGVAAHHLQNGELLPFLLINAHHKCITELCCTVLIINCVSPSPVVVSLYRS
jgi:hypothetical protein